MTVIPYRAPASFLSFPRVLLLESSSSLPPKPVDEQGRHVAWVLVTAEPGIWYGDRFISVDRDWIDRQVDLNEKLRTVAPRGGYRAPLLSEHQRTGERIGDVLELTRATVDGAEALVAAVAFSAPDAASKIDRQEIKYFSPGFGSVQDSGTGEEYTMILNEISQVSSPHQKGFGASHVLAKEIDTMGAQLKLEEVIDEKIEEKKDIKIKRDDDDIWGKLDELTARLDALEAYNKRMVEAEEAIVDEGETVEASEVGVLIAKVEGLELERDLAQYKGFVAGNPTITLSEDVKALLFGAWRQDKIKVSEILKAQMGPAPAAQLSEYTSTVGSSQHQPMSTDPEAVYRSTLAKTQSATDALAAYKRAKNLK